MKKVKILWFIAMLFTMINYSATAQNKITGKVIDKSNQKALEFVTVFVPEHNEGTLTDKNGEYTISNLPNGKVKIQFSFVGYKTTIQTISINSTETTVNVEMEASPFQLEEVVVSGGTYSTQHENAIKIELLKSKEIEQAGTPSFIEALSQMPGVDLISKGPGVAKPVIRGLSMTNILMLNNGVKMENFQFSENHPFIIDEFGVDRVEVIKDPASLLYGSDAVGGVVNVIREKPAPTNKIVGDYNMQFHSNTEGIVSNLGIKGSSDNFFWGIRGGIKSHSDYKDGNGDFVPNTRFNEKSFKANVGLNKSFGVFKVYYDYNRPKLGMCVDNAVNLVTSNGRENKYWYQDLSNQTISTQNTLFLGKYKLDLNAAYQMNNRKLQTDNSTPAFEMVDMNLNTLSYEMKTHLLSAINSEYIVGIQGANKTNRNHEAPNHVLPNANVNDFSVFGLFQHNFGKKLKSQAGVRYDYRHISTKAESGTDAVHTDFGNYSASIGATYRINNNILLRSNFASAYRTPNIAELTENGMHGTRYEQGNPDLKSQRSYETDLNIHFHSDYAMIDVSGFYNRINDYIFIAPTADTTSTGNKIYRYSQVNAKIYGGEISVNIMPVNWVNITTGYSYLIGKQDDGDYLPFIPQNKIKVDFKLQKDKLGFLKKPFFKVGGIYASKQNHPSTFETETDGYFLLNASVGTNIKWTNQLIFLSLQANNLLNETYIDHLSTLKDMGYYNMGRNVSLSITIPFGLK